MKPDRPPLRSLRLAAIACSGIAALCPLQARSANEATLKVAVIYNMLQYVSWPDEEKRTPGSPLVLCAGTEGSLWPALLAMQDRPVRNLRLRMAATAQAQIPADCDVLIVGVAAEDRELPGNLRERPVLIVKDGGPSVRDGTMIFLDMHDGRIVFDADHAAARRSGIRLSSKLLRLARSVSE